MQAEVVDRQFATKEWRNSWSIRILELKVISLHVEIIYSRIENGFIGGEPVMLCKSGAQRLLTYIFV